MENAKVLKGGEFLVRDFDTNEIFIPEELNEEQQMIAQTCQDFLETEVLPHLDAIDAQQEGLMPSILEKAGELGLLGISIPEEYDGFGQDIVTGMVAAEKLGAGYSFSVAYSCDTGIGTLPIVYYGNEEQKQKYLPKLASGEWKGSYCLTEPGAGSDANSGKTKAVLSEDGKHYILNGAKMWITNAGFADVHTVFAKIDNDRVLSAFIVEASSEGIVLNPEEKKMGIKGSSTRQIFYNDVKVPVENLLGKRGEGFRIALNILHMGRLKLGGNVIGAAKMAINQSVQYSNERKQFGMHLSSFGSIKHKLAEQMIRTFTTESAVYRASKYVQDEAARNHANGVAYGLGIMEAYNQFAIEAALLKVYGSESLDFIADEAVQIHGGMGFSAEMMVDRGYRDSRINRIFEGTNEINKILTIDTIIKRGSKKEIPLWDRACDAYALLQNLEETGVNGMDYFEEKYKYVNNIKSLALILIKSASDKFQKTLVHEQEVLNHISDIVMQAYVGESTYLRVKKLAEMKGENAIDLYKDILDVFLHDSATKVYKLAIDALNSIEDKDNYDKIMNAIRIFTKVAPLNIKESRRRLADKLIAENKYFM
ncbi:MAG: acyl-CoA dehydrogenase family protein [Salinivirgaceae bacterium]|nr:acyl-CoA dehydrogenase family protein [Salinivirgaceae bacterium]